MVRGGFGMVTLNFLAVMLACSYVYSLSTIFQNHQAY